MSAPEQPEPDPEVRHLVEKANAISEEFQNLHAEFEILQKRLRLLQERHVANEGDEE